MFNYIQNLFIRKGDINMSVGSIVLPLVSFMVGGVFGVGIMAVLQAGSNSDCPCSKCYPKCKGCEECNKPTEGTAKLTEDEKVYNELFGEGTSDEAEIVEEASEDVDVN